MRWLLWALAVSCTAGGTTATTADGGERAKGDVEADTDPDTDVDAGADTDADADADADRVTEVEAAADTDAGPAYWPADVDRRVCGDGTADHLDIQDAIDASAPGDVIGVCPGTYGPIEVRWGFDVEIRGIGGPSVTTIDGAGSPAVYVREGTLVMSGFTVTGAGREDRWFPMAGGITVWEGIGEFRDLVVEHCTGPFTLLFDEDFLVMDDVVWRDNTSSWLWYLWQGEDDPYGDGPPPPGSVVITDNVVLGGVHQTVVETTKLEVLTLANNVFSGITIDGGFTAFLLRAWNDGALTVTNNVFYDIDDTLPWGGRIFDGDADLRSNVVVGCDAYDVVPFAASYSLFWDNGAADYRSLVSGTGNVFADPRFEDPAAADFRLRAGSPAADAGDPDPAMNDPDGSRNDIGAHGGPEN